jgi:hypothetical protein
MRLTREQAAVKIDLDDDGPPLTIRDVTRLMRRAGYKPVALFIGRSPSGEGWHMILHVSPRPSSPFEVVALALLLGSDVNREAMQLFRARGFHDAPRFMKDAWNVLYEPHPQRARHLSLPE